MVSFWYRIVILTGIVVHALEDADDRRWCAVEPNFPPLSKGWSNESELKK